MPSKRRTSKDAKVKNRQERAKKGGAPETQTRAHKGSRAHENDSAGPGGEHSGIESESKHEVETERTSAEGALAKRGWTRKQVAFWTPPIPPATGIGLGTGASWLAVALATENVEPNFVWPSVVLVGLGMAYDLGRRLVDRRG